MPLIEYTPKKFGRNNLAVIASANSIIASYIAQGYKLTLRQLYYQFVSRDLLANTVKLNFSANGISGGSADPVNIAFFMQKTSGQV